MRPRIRKHTMRRPSQRRPYTQLIPRRTRNDKQRSLLPRQIRHGLLEGNRGGIFSEHIIEEGAGLSGGEHGGCGGCHGVTYSMVALVEGRSR